MRKTQKHKVKHNNLQPFVLLTPLNLQSATQNEIKHELPTIEDSILCAYRLKSYNRCLKQVETILKMSGQDLNHYKIIQAACYTMIGGHFPKVHLILDKVIKEEPWNSFAIYGKGVALFFEARFDEAIITFDRAIGVNPTNEMDRAREMRGHAVQYKTDIQTSSTTTAVQADIAPIDPQLKTEISESLPFVINNDECIHIDKVEITNSPPAITDESPAILNKVPQFPIEGDPVSSSEPDEASKMSDSIKQTKDPEELFSRGMCQYQAGNLKKALKLFERALKADSVMEKAEEMGSKVQELIELMDVASLNLTQKNYTMVVEIMNEALKIDPQNDFINRPFYFQRGLANFHLGKTEESVKDYAEFDKLNKKLQEK